MTNCKQMLMPLLMKKLRVVILLNLIRKVLKFVNTSTNKETTVWNEKYAKMYYIATYSVQQLHGNMEW